MLSGKKTYLLVAGAILVIVGEYLEGKIGVDGLIQGILSSGAIAALRSAIQKGPTQ